MFQFTRPGARAITTAAFLGAMLIARPSPAAEDFAPAPKSELVESRIKELHRKLHITAAQETQWNTVAQMMRDNAQAMVSLQKDRAEDAKDATMSAIEVLQSYSSVVDAHADGLHKFLPVFQAFYDTMSDQQKTTADALFRTRARTAAKHSQMSKN